LVFSYHVQSAKRSVRIISGLSRYPNCYGLRSEYRVPVIVVCLFLVFVTGQAVSAETGNLTLPWNYQIPQLQFDASQERIIVHGELSPVIEEDAAKNTLTRTAAKSTVSSTIPVGSIIYYSADGITTVFDKTGVQLFSADDTQAEMIPTLVGMIPATHVHTVPSGAYVNHSENGSYIMYNNTLLYVEIHENTGIAENPGAYSVSGDSSDFTTKSLESQTPATGISYTPVLESAVVNDPVFSPGQDFTAQWIVPDPPLQSVKLSPTYISMGLDETDYNGVYTSWHKFRPIIEYDYDQNAWFMSACTFERYSIWNWDAKCAGPFLIYPGDKIEGRIEYSEESYPSGPSPHFRALVGDYNTGLGISSGGGLSVKTYTISQLNINLQGDIDNLNESTITGDTTFSPINLPSSPTPYVNPSHSRLPHLSVENNWPKNIIFRTRAEPTEYTYSITQVGNTGSMFFKDISSEVNNSANLIDGAISHDPKGKWRYILWNKETAVTKEDLGTKGGGLNNATFHYHAGHGAKDWFFWGNTYLALSNGQTLHANEVKGMWGKNNKWIWLDACDILSDQSWSQALGTTHGIFGFTTSEWTIGREKTDFIEMAQGTAWHQGKAKPLSAAYIKATRDNQPSSVTAAVIFGNEDQFYNDYLPGHGSMVPDKDPNDHSFFYHEWQCRGPEVPS
jgi:hypothetical protein